MLCPIRVCAVQMQKTSLCLPMMPFDEATEDRSCVLLLLLVPAFEMDTEQSLKNNVGTGDEQMFHSE